MNLYNPERLPKIRSRKLLDEIRHMPCTLRIASFIPSHRCSPDDTVVPCHVQTIGKGMGTKVSDLFVVAGCMACHDLLDGRDKRWTWLMEHYPAAVMHRVVRAMCETQTMLMQAGILTVKGSSPVDGNFPTQVYPPPTVKGSHHE